MPDLPEVKKREFPLRRGSNYYIEFKGEQLILPSVTNIIGNALPKPQLVSWAARTAAATALKNPALSIEEAANSIYKSKMSAADKGKAIHSWAEAYGNGAALNSSDLPEELKAYGLAFEHFVSTQQPKFLYTESVVFNVTHGYAGSLDTIAETLAGKHAIFDYKTGKNTYYESHLQQEAYANAEYLMTKDKKIIKMPKIDEKYLVHLQDNGKSALVGVDEPFEDFLAVMKVWKILQRKEGKA